MPIEQWSDEVCVVHLADDPQFSDEMTGIDKHLSYYTKTDLVLDFTGVHYLNSTNFSKLLQLREFMVKNDNKLILCGISTRLWGTFLATGLDKVFTFCTDVSTSLATLQMA